MAGTAQVDLAQYIRTIPDFPKPGILYRDITPLLANPRAFRQAVSQLTDAFRDARPDVIAAAEARGFLLAGPLALELNAALVPIRKKGKLPFKTLSHTYDLEYGTDTLEIHCDAIPSGARVLVLDDVLATGGTMDACCQLVEKAGGTVVGCGFLLELLDCAGRARIAQRRIVTLVQCP